MQERIIRYKAICTMYKSVVCYFRGNPTRSWDRFDNVQNYLQKQRKHTTQPNENGWQTHSQYLYCAHVSKYLDSPYEHISQLAPLDVESSRCIRKIRLIATPLGWALILFSIESASNSKLLKLCLDFQQIEPTGRYWKNIFQCWFTTQWSKRLIKIHQIC